MHRQGPPHWRVHLKDRNDGGTAEGCADLAVSAIMRTVSVTAVNDGPSGAYIALLILEHHSELFAAGAFVFIYMLDSPPNNTLFPYTTLFRSAGSLTDNGSAVALNDFVSVADINA